MDDQSPTKQLFAAFKSGYTSEANKTLLALYQPVCARFSEELKCVLESNNTERLKELRLIASLHVDALSSWLDASTPHSPDSHLLILHSYWTDTVEDIIKAVKRAELGDGEDDDEGEEWKAEK